MGRKVAALAAVGAVIWAGSAGAQTSMSFQCPPAGAQTENSLATQDEWLGTDPADPTVCLVRMTGPGAAAVERRLPYAFWRLPFSHHGSEAATRAGLGQFYPATPGKTVTCDVFLPRTMGGDDPCRQTWTAIGVQPVKVRAGSFKAMVIERTEEGRGGNVFKGTWRRWVDLNTGVTVKQTYTPVRLRASGPQEWEPTSMVTPPPPAPPAPAPARQRQERGPRS